MTPRRGDGSPGAAPPGPRHEPHGTLADWSAAAHRVEAVRRREARAAAAAGRNRVDEAGRILPEDLGLERCPECHWWRDPVPAAAFAGVEAFRTYRTLARARCMCTTERCDRCGEPLLPDRPVPRYYAPERQQLHDSGGWWVAMAHEIRCGVGRGGTTPEASPRA